MEIYNEAVRDLLSTDNLPLRLLDDPEVNLLVLLFFFPLLFVYHDHCTKSLLFHQRGTIVEKLTEETLRDWSHLKNLLSICEGNKVLQMYCCYLVIAYLYVLYYFCSSKTDRGDFLE